MVNGSAVLTGLALWNQRISMSVDDDLIRHFNTALAPSLIFTRSTTASTSGSSTIDNTKQGLFALPCLALCDPYKNVKRLVQQVVQQIYKKSTTSWHVVGLVINTSEATRRTRLLCWSHVVVQQIHNMDSRWICSRSTTNRSNGVCA